MQNYEQRNNLLIKRNEEIKSRLFNQNVHVEQLFKGYVALGVVAPDNGEIITEHPTTREMFIQLKYENELKLMDKEKNILNPSDKFEYKKIIEEYIAKTFDLIATRWESILAFLNLWRKRRLESREKSFELMSEYSALENSQFDKWNQKAEQLFKKHIEMLEYQEKHLINEESLMDELEYLFNLRNKLLKTADETFLA
jgi:hypothetical protein